MAVTVFVDDAVLGRLPPICAKDGITAGDRIKQQIEIGGPSLGLAWLLLLAGPRGIVGLILVAVSDRREVLTERELAAASINLDLDASRRWVTISGAHPAFADAVRTRQLHPATR